MPQGRLSSPSTWIAGCAAVCVAGAVALSMAPADAAASSVTGTFGATGVTSSACSTEIGGNAVYLKPGQVFKAGTSLASIRVLGLSLPAGATPTALTGALLVKHGTSTVFNKLIGSKAATVATLPTGTFPYRFTARSLSFKGPLGLPGSIAVSFTWTGNVYATSKKDPCGLTISTPRVHVSASAPVLPPINVTLPGVNAPTLPNPLKSVSLPKLPKVPGVGGKTTTSKGGTKHTGSTGSVNYTPPAVTVPQEVMPHANAFGGAGGFAAPGGGSGGYAAPINAPALPASGAQPGSATPSPDTAPAKKAVDLSSRDQLGGQQLPVLLAIAAILALVSVTGMYARLYLLRRPTK